MSAGATAWGWENNAEQNQSEKDQYHVISLILEFKKENKRAKEKTERDRDQDTDQKL